MKNRSPFSLDRFEYESRHLYYLQKQIFERLEMPKPVYLVGSRGTGKTTLLQALNWEERRENRALAEMLDQEPERARYVGIYLKLPEIQFDVIRRWLQGQDENYAAIFAFFLDLVWLEALVDALSELVVDETFDISPQLEQEYIRNIINDFSVTFSGLPTTPTTLKELSRGIRDIRESLEILSRRKVEPSDVIARYRIVGQFGDFGRRMGALLHKFCVTKGEDRSSYKEWHFKICMDEGECLDAFQQKVVNTLLRVSKSPVFLVVSFVSMPSHAAETMIDNLTLQRADRELISLDDDISEKEFREMAEGVATTRLRAFAEDPNIKFNLQQTLGELDLNYLLQGILTNSVSPNAKKILGSAEALAKASGASDEPEQKGKSALPIYEAYLIDRLSLQTPKAATEQWQRRKDASVGVRKKFVAAYLSICAEVNAEVRYAFAEMVLQMSDMCIRDFLHQLDAVYDSAGWDLNKFISSQIPIDTQDKALKRASSEKYRSIPRSGVSEPNKVGALIEGLSRLTAVLQSRSSNFAHLRSSERGQFTIMMEKKPGEGGDLICQTIKDAAEAGFLKLIHQDRHEWRFRVHTSLAANYGFSYRGAYYQTHIDWRDIIELKNAESERDISRIINSVTNKLEGEAVPVNLSLFDDIDE